MRTAARKTGREPSCLEALPLLVQCFLHRLTPLFGKNLEPRKGPDRLLAVLPVCGEESRKAEMGVLPYSDQPLKIISEFQRGKVFI